MSFRVEVKNMKELVNQLDGLEQDIKKRVIQKAMLEAGKIVRNTARSLAPQKTGALRRSIRVRKLKKKEFKGSDEIGAVVDYNVKIARYAHIVEGGAKPHEIRPKYKKALKFKGGYAARVKHPGFKGRDILKNAALTTTTQVEFAIEKSIADSVRKISAQRGLD